MYLEAETPILPRTRSAEGPRLFQCRYAVKYIIFVPKPRGESLQRVQICTVKRIFSEDGRHWKLEGYLLRSIVCCLCVKQYRAGRRLEPCAESMSTLINLDLQGYHVSSYLLGSWASAVTPAHDCYAAKTTASPAQSGKGRRSRRRLAAA